MVLEINNIKKTGKFTKSWKQNSPHLNNQWIREEITTEIRKCLEMNENKNTTYQTLWDTAKAVLRGNTIAINVTLKNKRDLKSTT